MANVELTESENGLTTLGLEAKLAGVSRTAHQEFLVAQSLRYWKLIVIQIPGMRHILIFSGSPDNDGEPDYTLTDADQLKKRIGEILTLHHEQHTRHVSSSSAR